MQALRIHTERLGSVQEVTEYLARVDSAYNHVYAFLLITEDAEERYDESEYRRYRRSSRNKSRTLRTISKPETVVLPEDRLRLNRIVVESPGWWEFIGKLNPLEVLRQYLSDRHERIKDNSYRNRLEEERLMLQNEQLKTEVVQGRIEMLRGLGVSEDRVRQALNQHLAEPLALLDTVQNSGLIEGAELVEVPDTDGESDGENETRLLPP